MGTRVVGIASGKGGVGKTTLIVNLALQLTEFGKKVLIFDADLGMANVHLAFSKSISHDLSDVINGTVSLEETIVSLTEGIDLIPGGSGVADIAMAVAATMEVTAIATFVVVAAQTWFANMEVKQTTNRKKACTAEFNWPQ